jgi:hypothetical protein
MGRDLCRIVLGGNHCPFIYFDSFLASHHDISKNAFRRQAVCDSFGVPGVLDHGSVAFVGYVRRHGFILPIIRDWFFMPHGGLQWMMFLSVL